MADEDEYEDENEPNRKMPRLEEGGLLPVPLLSLQTNFIDQNTFQINNMQQMEYYNTDQFQQISTIITNQNRLPQTSTHFMNQNQFQFNPNFLVPFSLNDYNPEINEPSSNFNNRKRPRKF